MSGDERNNEWPAIPYAKWRETCSALHLWSQIVGKYKLAHTPWVNHSWHATLLVTTEGLTTGPVHEENRTLTLDFDLRAHRLLARADDGKRESFALEPMSVAQFFARTRALIEAVGGSPDLHSSPNEVPNPTPFPEDTAPRPYDAEAVQRFHRALLQVTRVFTYFRTSFLGKVSPVHLFWGSFDLAVTRFSGRRAPLHPGGIPALPDAVTREAYSHEVSSAGFWPGGSGVDDASFYSYAYPEPPGFKDWKVEPTGARYDPTLKEFLLPYEAVRSSSDPTATLLAFLRSTYEAAAECGRWDRSALECALGRARAPRAVTPPTAP